MFGLSGVWRLPILLLIFAGTPTTAAVPTGDISAHDPSRITKCNSKFFYYVTGPNIPMRSSADLTHWTTGPGVLSGVPAWAHAAVPLAKGDFVWAPDVIFRNHQYYLYYAYSTFGSRVSVIGLVTSPTLDPAQPGYHWTDRGEVIGSDRNSAFNAIDPCPTVDAQGRLWLSFGSWNRGGIQIVPLDKSTGKRTAPPVKIVAGQRTGPEGSFLWLHRGYYYVFENEGLCCQGMNSTYRIMVGRSKAITGPYLDKSGKDLAMGGGTLFLGTDGHRFGPGQVGIYSDGRTDHLSFHYYDGQANGRPTLGLGMLDWGKDGWPRAVVDEASAGTGLPEGHYAIVSQAGGLALAAPHDAGNSSLLALDPADQGATQWNVSRTWDGYFSIASLDNGRFLDLSDCSPKNGTVIDQYAWLDNDCQRWRIESADGGTYRIISKSSGSVVTAGGQTAGAPVQEQAWTGDGSQKWYFKRLP